MSEGNPPLVRFALRPCFYPAPYDYEMYIGFRDQLGRPPEKGVVVVDLSTLGGDPEVARMMGEDVRYHSDLE